MAYDCCLCIDYIQVSTLMKQRATLSHRKLLPQKEMDINTNEIKEEVRMFLSIGTSWFLTCLSAGAVGRKAQQIWKLNK